MAKEQRKYDEEYKVQAVKLAKELGVNAAARELGMPKGTLHTWVTAAKRGELDTGEGSHTPEEALNLAGELKALRRQVKEQEKEIKRLKEENEFLAEASAFFAASRRRSARSKG